jgi:hypothetical protein
MIDSSNMILVLSILKETPVCRYGPVLFVHYMAMSLLSISFKGKSVHVNVHVDTKIKATCFWLKLCCRIWGRLYC